MIYDYDNLEKYHTHIDRSAIETDNISETAIGPRPTESKQNTPHELVFTYATNEESFETDRYSGGRDYGVRIL